MGRRLKCPHCGEPILVITVEEPCDDEDDDELEFDEMGFTKRQFTGGDDG